MGGTITMVTQEGTTITIPAHELAAQGAHSVTMVTADGSDEQVGAAGTSLSGLFKGAPLEGSLDPSRPQVVDF